MRLITTIDDIEDWGYFEKLTFRNPTSNSILIRFKYQGAGKNILWKSPKHGEWCDEWRDNWHFSTKEGLSLDINKFKQYLIEHYQIHFPLTTEQEVPTDFPYTKVCNKIKQLEKRFNTRKQNALSLL